MSLAIDYNVRRKPARTKRLPRWLVATASAVIVLGLAALAVGMLIGPRPLIIEQPQREMMALLKECKITASLHPTECAGQIVTGRDGVEWYTCKLTAPERDAMIDALRARVDGRSVRVTSDNGSSKAGPAWWTPEKSGDLLAIEIDAPTYWIAVAKDQSRMYLRRAR